MRAVGCLQHAIERALCTTAAQASVLRTGGAAVWAGQGRTRWGPGMGRPFQRCFPACPRMCHSMPATALIAPSSCGGDPLFPGACCGWALPAACRNCNCNCNRSAGGSFRRPGAVATAAVRCHVGTPALLLRSASCAGDRLGYRAADDGEGATPVMSQTPLGLALVQYGARARGTRVRCLGRREQMEHRPRMCVGGWRNRACPLSRRPLIHMM